MSHMVAAYSIEAFMDTAEFKTTMDEWLRMLKSTKPAAGHPRVFYPGLPEAEAEVEHRAHGIQLHPEVIDWFRTICAELKVANQL
jgi:L-2-hydroxycarboxylate dehydrogenase (NAD+)